MSASLWRKSKKIFLGKLAFLVPNIRKCGGNDVIAQILKITSMDFWFSFFLFITLPYSLIELDGTFVIGIKTESCFTVSKGGAIITH